MENKGTSTLNNGLIWFGAGVSIAEILTGTYLAPLGFEKGLAASYRKEIAGYEAAFSFCLHSFFSSCPLDGFHRSGSE